MKIDHEFHLLLSDSHSYKHSFTISNSYSSVEEFYKSLEKLNLNDNELMRPQWDTYFMRIAHITSSRTNCMKRAVGAVIVKDCQIISAGYNGTPFGYLNCNEGGCERCNSNKPSGVGLDQCICIHAEENAVI